MATCSKPGQAYLAPGGKQMLLEGRGPGARLRIIDGNDKVNYKPCVDITFASAAKTYGDKVLAIVLTGMGADGRDGARLLKEQGRPSGRRMKPPAWSMACPRPLPRRA